MLCSKIDRSRWKTINSGSDLTKNEFYCILEKQKCRCVETGVASLPKRLAEVSQRGGPPITNIYIAICCIKWFFPLNVFLLKILSSRAHNFCRRVYTLSKIRQTENHFLPVQRQQCKRTNDFCYLCKSFQRIPLVFWYILFHEICLLLWCMKN
jgi:hypothetical protein